MVNILIYFRVTVSMDNFVLKHAAASQLDPEMRSVAAIKRFWQDLSAIHNKSLTRHESSMDGGKEGSREANITRRPKTFQGYGPNHLLSIIFPQVCQTFSFDIPRQDRINSDSVSR